MGKLNRNPLIKLRSTKFGNNFIVQKSIKNGETLIFESYLEYLVFLMFDTDSDIARIDMHPKLADIIKAELEEEIPNGYLDMRLTHTDGYVEYIEIKYADDLDESNDSQLAERSRRQVALQKEICEIKGIPYRVITDKDLRPKTDYIENLKCIESNLLRIKKNGVLVNINSKSVLEAVKSYGKVAICELENLFDGRMLWDCIYSLYYHKQITMDINHTISGKTEVMVYEEA